MPCFCASEALGALGDELRDGAFARAEVGDHHGRHELEQRFGDAFPGTAGDVLAAEFSGQLIEVAPHFVLPHAERVAQGGAIVFGIGDLAGGLVQQIHHARRRFQAVEGVLAGAAIVHQTGLFELRQAGGDLALAFAQYLLKLRHGELFLFQKQQNAEAVRIGRQPQCFED
jgi:hypothetical protein